ncbi:MAG: CHAT domain-containing protein [Methanobacteriota archaeon]|nr:MAG: CHAT domain-containing protein [Euryarchaeota archaeon]
MKRKLVIISIVALGMLLFFSCQSQNTQEVIPAYRVTIRVIPQTLPEGTTVYIRGNITPLGNGAPAKVPMTRAPDGSWSKSLMLPQDLKLEFFFDLGSDLNGAVGADSLPLGRMHLTVTEDTTIVVQVFNWENALLSPEEKSSPEYRAKRFFCKADSFYVWSDYGANADSARSYYLKAMELYRRQRNWVQLVNCNLAIAAVPVSISHGREGFDQKLRYCNEALALAETHLGKNHDETGKALYYLAGHYGSFGDYQKALELTRQALEIHLANHGEEHWYIHGELGLIAHLYRELGDYDRAIEYRQRQLDAKIKFCGPTHQEVANTFKALGKLYADMGEFERAIDYYKRARRIHVFFNEELSVTTHMSYFELGKIYRQAGEYENAQKYLHKALDIRQRMYEPFHGHIAWALLAIAETSYRQHHYTDALGEIQHSLEILFPGFQGQDGYVNPPIEDVLHFRPAVLDALILKGRILQGMAQQSRQSLWRTSAAAVKNFEAALECYDDALQLAALSLRGILTTNAKLYLQRKLSTVVEQAIAAAQELHELTANPAHLEKALDFAARGKTALLRLELEDSDAKAASGIDTEFIRKERLLARQIADLDISIAREKQQAQRQQQKINDLESERHQLKTEHESLLQKLEENYPRYDELKHQPAIPGVRELQETLDEKTALLNYFVGDSAMYLFLLTKDDLKLVSLPGREEFSSLVTAYTRSIRRIIDAGKYVESAIRLYDMLVRPVEADLSGYQKLIIIPDGVLYNVPFEALITSPPTSGDNIDFTKLEYLLRRFSVSYHYSTTLYQRSRTGQSRSTSAEKILGIAPVFRAADSGSQLLASNESMFSRLDTTVRSAVVTPDGHNLQELRYSETETQTIVDLFHDAESIGFFHDQATEEHFKTNVGKFRLVHISTHGFINRTYPQLSGLAFSQPRDTTSAEDGILYAGEIYTLKLKADLVVLSSCESGIGKLAKGEGPFSLTRGFLFAGANNVMVSLWKVYDKHTSELMIAFYQEVVSGKSYATSLRNAKLRMLEKAETALPVSWAGFVLVGG